MDINYNMITEYCRPGMKRYIEQGIPVGDFLTAVLENNFVNAVARADPENITRLRDYMYFLINEVPSPAWGSKKKVKAWIKMGGLNGRKDE
jgi:hypothetical protein